MRIELPIPSWAEAQRAQDDAHTLTLPAHPHALPVPLLDALAGAETATARVAVSAAAQSALTLTFHRTAEPERH